MTPRGWTLAYCYGRDDAMGVGYSGRTVDEARRVATNIAKLPELLRRDDGDRRTGAAGA